MLLAKGDIKSVVRGCSLKFKIERTAEPFAQRKAPGLVNPPTKRSVNHELHAATFIEEPLRDDRSLRRNRAQNRASRQDVFHNLLGGTLIEAAFLPQPIYG